MSLAHKIINLASDLFIYYTDKTANGVENVFSGLYISFEIWCHLKLHLAK